MPKKYDDIKESYEKRGKTEKEAERLAAMTYNSQRKPGQKPVTRNSDKSKSGITVIESFENGRTSVLKP